MKNEEPGAELIPLVYVVHAANLFGTERMALETLDGFRSRYRPVLLCPPGPLVDEARRREVTVYPIKNRLALFGLLFRLFRGNARLVLMTTAITHSLAVWSINFIYRRTISHLHMVHGGADEHNSYGRKKRLNRFPLLLVAVSPFVKERLIAHRVRPGKIRVVGNFLTEETVSAIPRRPLFQDGDAPKKGIVISRVIPSKRVDLLFDALERYRDLDFSFVVYGLGGRLKSLRERAEKNGLPIDLPGFASDLNKRTAEYDFLLHLCPEEPFGLAVLEGMAAGIPVLVPDRGGVLSIVEDGRTGLFFKADDPDSLAECLCRLSGMSAKNLNQMTEHAHRSLTEKFSCESQIQKYQEIIDACRNP